MSGGSNSLTLDGQSTAQRGLKDARQLAALQGANIAFNAHTLHSSPSDVSHDSSKATRAAVLADQAKRAGQPSDDDTESEMPVDGFVTDRIKQFSGGSTPSSTTSSQRSGQPATKNASIPIQAASLAAERSAGRTPQSSRATPSVSPARVPPKPQPNNLNVTTPETDSLRNRPAKPLPAPVPVRKPSGIVESLAKSTERDKGNNNRTNSESPIPRSSATSVTRTPPLRKLPSRKPVNPRPTSAGNIERPNDRRPKSPTSPRGEVRTEKPHARKPPPAVPKPRRTAATATTTANEEQPKPALPPRTSTLSVDEEGHTSSSSAADDKANNSIRRRIRSTSVSTRSSNNALSDQLRATNHAQGSARAESSDTNRITKEALADAIVASSLASSRTESPVKEPPPLPPGRRARSRSLLHPTDIFKGEPQRKTTSPPKGMRRTLREPSKSDDEEGKRQKGKHLIRHHPHKYHEGGRKRWRQEIPERERKRYEGVWAANKGLCVPPPAVISELFPRLPPVVPSEMVVHLVVRDIWSRSRLPYHTLEEIWNLVDQYGIGLLSREQFVVGLWLIDQSLKGHKIPVKVPESVWESVRHAPGLKMPSRLE